MSCATVMRAACRDFRAQSGAPAEAPPAGSERSGWRRAVSTARPPPRTIRTLGFISFFINLSSETIHVLCRCSSFHPRRGGSSAGPRSAMASDAGRCGLWGYTWQRSRGVLSAMVADTAPGGLRASAFGAFGLAQGLALLVGSAISGRLWRVVSPMPAFLVGAVFGQATLPRLRGGEGRAPRPRGAASVP